MVAHRRSRALSASSTGCDSAGDAGAGDISRRAGLNSFIRCLVVLAVIHSVAHLSLRNATVVSAGELAFTAARIIAVDLIRSIPAVILVIALPRAEDATAIAAPKLGWLAGVRRAVVRVLVGVVPAVVVSIASPQPRDALAVGAGELVAAAVIVARAAIGRRRLVDAHFAFIDCREPVGAATQGLAVWARMARVRAAAVVDLAHVHCAVLPLWSVDLNAARRIVQTFHNFLHVGSRVLLCSVHASQLQISPVNVVPIYCNGEGINCGCHKGFECTSANPN